MKERGGSKKKTQNKNKIYIYIYIYSKIEKLKQHWCIMKLSKMKENPERVLTWFSFETIAAACCCNKGAGITGDTLPEFAESRFIKRDTGVTPSTETTQGHLMRQLQAVQAQQKLRTLQADPIFSSYNNCQKV